MHVILTEKPSASRHFAKALGGMSGTYNGVQYQIIASRGHLLTFKEPHQNVPKDYVDQFASWQTGMMPWPLKVVQWKKAPIIGVNPHTKKKESTAPLIQSLGQIIHQADVVVVATDVDPSGEGELLAFEILDAVGYRGKLERMYFTDEAEKSLQKAFCERKVIQRPTDGDLLKAQARERFDYSSMQLTRLCTTLARQLGLQVRSVRQGRLKSVMVKLVYDQLNAIKHYVKKPFYEVRFKDEKGNVYQRSIEHAEESRFEKKRDAESDLACYHESPVTCLSVTDKEQAPGALLDLAGLSSILESKGYLSKEILATYQKLYEDQFVSYPRTEDKKITPEQYQEMLPLVDSIANVVGVDPRLLTHRTPRKQHVAVGGSHGANRPGVKVPKTLASLATYGKSAQAIYETLAKNFLAIFAENYRYKQYKGVLKKYPNFQTTAHVTTSLGYKAVFDSQKETADEAVDDSSQGLGQVGSPFIFEGSNKKPIAPTMKWLMNQLKKYSVGTGATRTSTYSDITTGQNALLKVSRGKLSMAPVGIVAATFLEDSYIGSPKVTEQVLGVMDQIGKQCQDPNVILKYADYVVQHDKVVFMKNVQKLKIQKEVKSMIGKEKVSGVHPTFGEVSFSREWGDHRFTDQEVQTLLDGGEVSFDYKDSQIKGKLEAQEYKGRSFIGFKAQFPDNSSERYSGTHPKFGQVSFKKKWGTHTFTQAEADKLIKGDSVTFDYKNGEITGTLEKRTWKGKTFIGFTPHFDD